MNCIMKITVIISIALVTQVSASFFDVIQGAVLSVQTSFGKLLSDVVTDVKITVDCTILAVEHILSLSDDATDRYYEQCKGATEPNTPLNNDAQNSGYSTVMPKEDVSVKISHEDLKKNLPEEINATVNKTLTKILDGHNIKNKLESVEDVLAKETERLADVNVVVNEELDKLSSEVNSDIRRVEKNDSSAPSIETVLKNVKLLQDMELNNKNSSEAKEIHHVVGKVLDKLDKMEDTEASDNIRLEEILKDMESHSNDSFSDLEKQFDEWKEERSKYLDDIKDKMEEEKEMSENFTFEDASNRLSEGPNRISNRTNQEQLSNTILSTEYEIETENTSDKATHTTDNSLIIFSTEPPPKNISTTTFSTPATDTPMVNNYNSEQTVNTNISIQKSSVEELGNLMDVQSSFISGNVSTSSLNLIESTSPETLITTDSSFTTQNTVTDQPKVNPTIIDKNTTYPSTDHFTESTTETIAIQIFSNYSNRAEPVIHAYIKHNKESTIMDTDSTVTTYEPFIPQTVLIDKYYDKNKRSSKEINIIALDNPITSEFTEVSTVIPEDFPTTHERTNNLNSPHHFAAKPFIDVPTKSIAPNLGNYRISRRINDESQVHLTAGSSDWIGSTTDANKESSVLTTIKPVHLNYQTVYNPQKTSLDYDAFFNRATNNSPIHNKAVKDARRLIEDSEKTDLIMSSILKYKKAGRSIFSYPAPANFGK